MNNVTRTSLLSLLALSVPVMAQSVEASPLVITADSPAFNKDFSVDVGVSLESVPEVVTHGTKNVITYRDVTKDVITYRDVTTYKDVVNEVTTWKTIDCKRVPVTTHVTTKVPVVTKEKVVNHVTTQEATTSKVATTKVDKAYVRTEDSERLNLRLGGDTLATVSRQTTGDFAGGVAFRFGSVALASNVNTRGDVTGSATVSPAKNLAVYAEYDKKAINYGAQYQAGDVAFQVYSRPSSQAYGFGIAMNIGSAPTSSTKAGGLRLSELPGPYLPINTPSTTTSNGTPIEVEQTKPRVRG